MNREMDKDNDFFRKPIRVRHNMPVKNLIPREKTNQNTEISTKLLARITEENRPLENTVFTDIKEEVCERKGLIKRIKFLFSQWLSPREGHF